MAWGRYWSVAGPPSGRRVDGSEAIQREVHRAPELGVVPEERAGGVEHEQPQGEPGLGEEPLAVDPVLPPQRPERAGLRNGGVDLVDPVRLVAVDRLDRRHAETRRGGRRRSPRRSVAGARRRMGCGGARSARRAGTRQRGRALQPRNLGRYLPDRSGSDGGTAHKYGIAVRAAKVAARASEAERQACCRVRPRPDAVLGSALPATSAAPTMSRSCPLQGELILGASVRLTARANALARTGSRR